MTTTEHGNEGKRCSYSPHGHYKSAIVAVHVLITWYAILTRQSGYRRRRADNKSTLWFELLHFDVIKSDAKTADKDAN